MEDESLEKLKDFGLQLGLASQQYKDHPATQNLLLFIGYCLEHFGKVPFDDAFEQWSQYMNRNKEEIQSLKAQRDQLLEQLKTDC